jgi:hypothetical protein
LGKLRTAICILRLVNEGSATLLDSDVDHDPSIAGVLELLPLCPNLAKSTKSTYIPLSSFGRNELASRAKAALLTTFCKTRC